MKCFVGETAELCGVLFLLFQFFSVTGRHGNVFLRRQVSQGERQRGVTAQETFKSCQPFVKVTASFSSPLQAMSRSSSVEGRRNIPARRGVESIFSSDKKDAKVFKKIVGATNLVMKINEASQKQEETFYIYNIL